MNAPGRTIAPGDARRRYRRAPLPVTVLAAISMAACGNPSPASKPAGGSGASTTAASTTAPVTTTTEAPPLAAGRQGSVAVIPWGRVGYGWMVALWSPNAPSEPPGGGTTLPPATTTLFLVDPLGGRYRITTLPSRFGYELVDWSGDGKRVLLERYPQGAYTSQPVLEEIGLASGAVLHSFSFGGSDSARYTRPDGKALFEWTQGTGGSTGPGATLERLNLSGSTQLAYPTTFPGKDDFAGGDGDVLPALDGLTLVVGTNQGMALLTNGGTFLRRIGPPDMSCTPARWWARTVIVASCVRVNGPSGSASLTAPAIWLVPVDGAAATQLTAPAQPDLGDLDAWKVGGGIYMESEGACGALMLTRRLADGTTTPVQVPGANGSIVVIGADSGRLALMSRLECYGGISLYWLNPVNGDKVPLLGPPVNGGAVVSALPYPGLERA